MDERVSQFAQQIPTRYNGAYAIPGAIYYGPGRVRSISESVLVYHNNRKYDFVNFVLLIRKC